MTGPNPLRLTVIDYEPIPNVTPEQAEQATRRIAEHARDADDARALLDVVFGKVQIKPPRGFREREPRDPNTYKPCGTSARYQQHRRRGEPIDDACRTANSTAETARRRQRKAAKETT